MYVKPGLRMNNYYTNHMCIIIMSVSVDRSYYIYYSIKIENWLCYLQMSLHWLLIYEQFGIQNKPWANTK